MISLSKKHITTIKDAAKKLTGAKRREFQAQVSIDYSKAPLAERIFGWDRKTVAFNRLKQIYIKNAVESDGTETP